MFVSTNYSRLLVVPSGAQREVSNSIQKALERKPSNLAIRILMKTLFWISLGIFLGIGMVLGSWIHIAVVEQSKRDLFSSALLFLLYLIVIASVFPKWYLRVNNNNKQRRTESPSFRNLIK